MSTTLERSDLRESITRPIDRAGRHLFRASIDRRSVQRRDDDGDGAIGFVGHAIVWNTPTWIGSKRWGFWEQIAPEAVTKTLEEADIRFLVNHDPNLLLARNKAGTLRLSSDGTGLAVDADMAPVSYAQDLAVLLERGDISQMSFAFEELAYKYEELDDGEALYTVTELRLFDVSVVTYPAYESTDAGLRSYAFEQLCRTAGLTPADSRQVMRHFALGEPIDPELLAAIRGVQPATPSTPAPAGSDHAPAETTRDDSPPAGTTGTTPISQARRRHLATRTDITRETL